MRFGLIQSALAMIALAARSDMEAVLAEAKSKAPWTDGVGHA